jgi:hypothetical protein
MIVRRITLVLLFFFVLNTVNAQKWGDYTFYSVQNTNAAYLLDTNNVVYKTWTFSSAPTGYSSYLIPGGTMYRSVKYTPNSFQGGGQTGKIQKIAYDGTVLWNFVYSTTAYSAHHDFCVLPNGNVLLIAYESKSAAEVSAAGGNSSIIMWPEKIVEVKPTGLTTGDVVWEWHVWDHLVQNVNAAKANYQTSIVEHPELLNINYKQSKDWIHMNGIDYNPMLDQIVVSSHNLNEWWIIDHSTTTAEAAGHIGGNAGKGGDFLYRWGNPAAYGASGTAILNVTHDAHWIPEGVPNAGRLVGYNNRGVSNNASAVDQIEVPRVDYNYTKNGTAAYLPSTYASRHACNGYSSNMSNSLQLPNGNTFVCMATSGYMYEVNPAGSIIWSKTATGTVAQAQRYSACYINNPAPAIPSISALGAVLECTDAATYQWYRNGNLIEGATNKNYTPLQSGIYVVRVTDLVSCVYSYSPGYKFTSTTAFAIGLNTTKASICIGDSTNINAEVINASDTTVYTWTSNPAGFSSNNKNIKVSPSVNTTYILSASDSNRTAIDSIKVTVNALPAKPNVSLLNDSTLSSSDASKYQWYLNEQAIIGATSKTYKPISSGSYKVQTTNANDCISELSDAFQFTIVVQGLSLEQQNRLMQLYPNPSSGIVIIKGEILNHHQYTLTVFDTYGKLLESFVNPSQLDLRNYASGMYYIQYIGQDGISLRKKLILTK